MSLFVAILAQQPFSIKNELHKSAINKTYCVHDNLNFRRSFLDLKMSRLTKGQFIIVLYPVNNLCRHDNCKPWLD